MSNYQYVTRAKLPTRMGNFVIHVFVDNSTGKEHVALTCGNWEKDTVVPIRIHSECLTGDALFSTKCDCGFQLEMAMQKLASNGYGAILYLRQEGRGIGLLNKIKAYKLQDEGLDTVEANEHLGFDADIRDYSICQTMLETLNIEKVSIMTNNPKKIAALQEMGIEVIERKPIEQGFNKDNIEYLRTKNEKLGHVINPEKLK